MLLAFRILALEYTLHQPCLVGALQSEERRRGIVMLEFSMNDERTLSCRRHGSQHGLAAGCGPLDLAASHCMCGTSLPSAPLIANALLSTEALSHCLGLGIIHLRAGNHTTGVRVYV